MSEQIQSLVDLRGYDAAQILQFVPLLPQCGPERLLPTTIGTPAYENAPYEIRTVSASSIPGIAVGDRVLFSRCLSSDELKEGC